MVMTETKSEEKQLVSKAKSTQKNTPVRYPFNFDERHDRMPVDERFQRKLKMQSAEQKTLKTDQGKFIREESKGNGTQSIN